MRTTINKRTQTLLRSTLALGFLLFACNLPSATGPSDAPTVPLDTPTTEGAAAPDPSETPAVEIATDEPSAENTPISQDPPPPIPNTLPPGPITLLTLGDSLTEGMGDEARGDGYPGRLIESLQALRPGSTLFNYGISGWNSDYLINGGDGLPSQLQPALAEAQRAQAAGEPVLALVWIGSNDLWYLYEYGPDPITAEAESFDLENYTRNLTTIVTELQNAGAVVILAIYDDQSQRPFLANLPSEVLPFTTAEDRARMSLQVLAYNEVIRTLAAQYGTGTVDFFNTDLFTNPETMAEDGIHPNAAGYELIAEMWLEAILPLLD